MIQHFLLQPTEKNTFYFGIQYAYVLMHSDVFHLILFYFIFLNASCDPLNGFYDPKLIFLWVSTHNLKNTSLASIIQCQAQI